MRNYDHNKGVRNPMYGKNHSEKTRKLQSELMKRRFESGWIHPLKGKKRMFDEKWRENIGRLISKERREAFSDLVKENWKKPEYREFMKTVWKKAMSSGALNKKSKAEMMAENILKNFGYRFVGDGSFWIAGKNPDFVNEHEKKIIEIFSVFHDENIFDVEWHRTEAGTMKIYAENGWICSVIWYPKKSQDKLEIEKFKLEVIKCASNSL